MAYLMKGMHWNDRDTVRTKMPYPVWVEPKHDDIRVRVTVPRDHNEPVRYLSYAEKPLNNLGYLDAMFRSIAERFQCGEFDCGFQVDSNFNKTYRWVRSKSVPADLEDCPTAMYLYDLPNERFSYVYRKGRVERICAYAATQGWPLLYVSHAVCNTEEEVLRWFGIYRDQMYEGAMVKQPEHRYQIGKRTRDWLKLKPEETADGRIIAVHEAIASVDQPDLCIRVGDPLGRVGSVTVKLEDGSIATPHGIPHALGTDMLLRPRKYIGEWCEFAYMERDRQSGYRHPVFRRLRDPK